MQANGSKRELENKKSPVRVTLLDVSMVTERLLIEIWQNNNLLASGGIKAQDLLYTGNVEYGIIHLLGIISVKDFY